MKDKIYVFHSDPGHGWLAVKRQELIDLGIEKNISGYSYQKGNTVYLEEDCDMGIFVKALQGRNIEFKHRSSYQEKTPIRYYQSFSAT